MENADYVIVGAGSAGCALADKLSEDGRRTVLVLEAGGSDFRFWIKVPIGYGRTFYDERVNWKFESEPEPGLDNRRIYWPRGRVVGGSSSINAMVYVRGMPADFEDWRAAGNVGWGWDDVEPYFRRSERSVDADGGRGDGPLSVSSIVRDAHPLSRHFFAAAREIGLAVTDDFNGPEKEGVGFYRITTHRGLRCSSADAFLRPALRRRNCRIVTHALVRRIVFDGHRATGVEYARGGIAETVGARRAVILSAGAVGSPQILQLSGIGPGAHLQSLALPVIRDSVAVGGHLQDHLGLDYYFKSKEPTLNDRLNSWPGKLLQGLRYLLTRRGPLSISVNQCGGFVRSRAEGPRPDLQLYFNPLTYTKAPKGKRPLMRPDPFSAFAFGFQPSRPSSRGRIDIRSPDPGVPPRIVPNSLSTAEDIADVVAGGRFLKRMIATRALSGVIDEALPPNLAAMDDAAILADFRRRAGTVFHPVGTCRMSPDPADGVVDPRLRVHGVDGLRIVDASVFPNLTSGNTNAPTIMVAQKAADLIRADD
jgi:choline dehydrogenase